MKLSIKEIKTLITCLENAEDKWTWEGNTELISLKEKLQHKLNEITGKESRLLSNSELKNIGL